MLDYRTLLNLATSVIEMRCLVQTENVCFLRKEKRSNILQVYKKSSWIGNRFENWISSLFRFREEVYNLGTINFESKHENGTPQKLDVVTSYLISSCVVDLSADFKEKAEYESMNVVELWPIEFSGSCWVDFQQFQGMRRSQLDFTV